MEQATGILIERNAQGIPSFARIDLKKYGDKLMPFFKDIGMEQEVSPYSKKYVQMINQAEENIKAGKGKKIDIAGLWK
ncbi:MAG: hypothetical protein LBG45_09565 [Dysgonamonadaceae bacterium]|jgi:hypothetical protein|nr:hypothetical protein [Dysgonamonadaceae bacterium]